MWKTIRTALAILALGGPGGPVLAADPSDPEWPCIQRKIPNLSIGVMWPHPLPEEATSLPPDLDDVAAQLALRRVSEEQAQALIDEVAARHPEFGLEDYGRLFQSTFERIDRQRSDIVAGIGRYARNQTQLATEVDQLEAEMSELEAAEAPDFDRMDVLEAELDWRIRIFNDRSKALTYVCESPVLLEQRAYAIAQMLLKAAG
jgi:hypothetical protein